MIQRIQSIYLLLVGILSSLLFFFPFQKNIVGLSEIKAIQLSLMENENNFLLIASILNLIILVDSITSIFLFRNRKLQMILCLYLLAMNIAMLGLMYFGSTQIDGMPTYQLPFVIPVLNIILSFFAYKNIKRDEELVKSADRIR
ncbi:MAG: DUF4293 domain-containing protein [Bacteroidota bacterium]